MSKIVLALLLVVTIAGCAAPTAAQAPAWSAEETAYWLAIDKAFPYPGYSSAPQSDPEGLDSVTVAAPPGMAQLQLRAIWAGMDCQDLPDLDQCRDANRAVRLELARLVEAKGSYPEGYKHFPLLNE